MRVSQIDRHDGPVRARPNSLAELFVCFTWLAVQGFGGAAPVAHRELVERKRWMTQTEFVEDWAVAQIMPGPNVINLSLMLGDRYFGLRGALTALAGMLTIPLMLVVSLAIIYMEYAHYDMVERALYSMGAVAAGLIIGTGFKLFSTLRNNPLGVPVSLALFAFTFVVIALMRWPLLWVLLGTGILGTLWAWLQLNRREQKDRQ